MCHYTGTYRLSKRSKTRVTPMAQTMRVGLCSCGQEFSRGGFLRMIYVAWVSERDFTGTALFHAPKEYVVHVKTACQGPGPGPQRLWSEMLAQPCILWKRPMFYTIPP